MTNFRCRRTAERIPTGDVGAGAGRRLAEDGPESSESYERRRQSRPLLQPYCNGRRRSVGGPSPEGVQVVDFHGGQGRNRTTDTRIFSPLLYQLSYLAAFGEGRVLDRSRGRPSSNLEAKLLIQGGIPQGRLPPEAPRPAPRLLVRSVWLPDPPPRAALRPAGRPPKAAPGLPVLAVAERNARSLSPWSRPMTRVPAPRRPAEAAPGVRLARRAGAGLHVLCEKPMAVTSSDCARMIEVTRENDVRLIIAYRLHFGRANLQATKMARSGTLGDLRFSPIRERLSPVGRTPRLPSARAIP